MYAISNAIFAMLETSRTNVCQYDELFEKRKPHDKCHTLLLVLLSKINI